MSPSEALKNHWTAVFAGVVFHAQAPVSVEIVQDGIVHAIKVIPLKARTINRDDGTMETLETVKVMILKDEESTYATTSTFIGGLALIKLGTQLILNDKKYVHTGEVPDDSDHYTVAMFERKIRSVQGKGAR